MEESQEVKRRYQEVESVIVQTEINDKLQEEVSRLKSELLERNNVSLEAKRQSYLNDTENLQTQLRLLEKEIWDSKMAVDVSSHELADKRQKISTMSQSLTVHKELLGEYEKQIGSYCRQLTMQKAEIELLSKSLAIRESDRLSKGVGAADLAKRSEECEEVLLVTRVRQECAKSAPRVRQDCAKSAPRVRCSNARTL